jgi:hypothetical protein
MNKYYSLFYQTRINQLYENFSKGKLNSTEAISLIQKPILFKEMSHIKRINDEIDSYKKAPLGGKWLKLLLKNLESSYKVYLISNDLKSNEYPYKKFLEDAMKNSKKVKEQYIDVVKDKESFWKIVSMINELL